MRCRALASARREAGDHRAIPVLDLAKEVAELNLDVDQRGVHVVDVHEKPIRRAATFGLYAGRVVVIRGIIRTR